MNRLSGSELNKFLDAKATKFNKASFIKKIYMHSTYV